MSTRRQALRNAAQLAAHESRRPLVREERVRGGEEKALDLLVRVLAELHRDRRRCCRCRVRGCRHPHRHLPLDPRDLPDGADPLDHLRPREALGEDDSQHLRRRHVVARRRRRLASARDQRHRRQRGGAGTALSRLPAPAEVVGEEMRGRARVVAVGEHRREALVEELDGNGETRPQRRRRSARSPAPARRARP